MLLNLHISKYALIDNSDIEFHSGFSVITGETGAGKSILLGALGLLTGERADVRTIKEGANKCTVEAVFKAGGTDISRFFSDNELDFDGSECILRREISINGKSRAFINDTPVTLAQMKALGRKLIDIHSQHQNLLLSGSDFQLNILDSIAQNGSLLSTYKRLFSEYKNSSAELASLKENISRKRSDEDYLRFQLEQLDEAQLKEGEQEELEQEQQMLSHAEEIKETLFGICNAFDGEEHSLLEVLSRSSANLFHISRYYPEAQSLSERLESASIELKDIIEEVKSKLDDEGSDPSRLQEIDERLSFIYDMQRKHRLDSVSELLAKADEIRKQLSLIDDADEILAEKERKCVSLKKKAEEQASLLSSARRLAAKKISAGIEQRLIPLGMPDIRFVIKITTADELSGTGADNVRFLFSANKSTPLREISEIASGGEIARVMLCLKAIMSNVAGCPTIIFDEIDTGVSGRIAEQMALTMQKMSHDGRQVISITHLPQIAARGERHYRVYKQNDDSTTTSNIELLTPDERISEIAYMLSGRNITDAAIKNAHELLDYKNNK